MTLLNVASFAWGIYCGLTIRPLPRAIAFALLGSALMIVINWLIQ